ncbi:MAG TPA: glycoside hydrolase family 3 C-terminal domain-containing protein, partial [Actinomycetota bacterium]|nr:glycoside hydrolase family 3 C-terminal domain-containing protein [Actinomycetota bacterium]
ELLNTTLRQQWGFQGYVITDRSALHDLGPSIKAGVDWELSHQVPLQYSLDPQPGSRNNPGSEGIRAALQAGTITISDIDQMLRHRYVQMFKFGQFDVDFDALFGATPDFFSHGLVAREIAQESIVLLKNQNSFLPLNAATLKSVALIGPTWFAGLAKLPFRGTFANAPYTVTPQQGLENVLRTLGSTATVTYESGGGTGTKADLDNAVALAKKSDVVIVMVGDDPREGCDRDTLRLPIVPPANLDFCGWDELTPGQYNLPTPPRGTGTDQDALMQELTADSAIAQKMVVVLKTEGMVLMPWLDKVPALVEAWYPGQEDGNVVANVLFGLRNPSGKLPVTFGNSEREAAYATTAQFPGLWGPPPFWSSDETLSPQYTEGLQVGYRWYEANNVAPLFPFGFGLSYTTFAYSGLSVASATGQSGEPVLNVTYTITNTGNREGAEASQVYLTLPPAAGEPSKRLAGFQKVDLLPGASQQVTVTIDGAASNHPFSYWVPQNDAPAPGWSNGSWSTAAGDYTISVGGSSADTPLAQTVALAGTATPAQPRTCSSVQPAPDWVCVNGGWLPPGLAPPSGAPGPPPTPPGNCSTAQPAPDWVCVNGGWLPPGLAPATGAPAPPPTSPGNPPASCATVQPGPGWVCVNGGWLPPGHPLSMGSAFSQRDPVQPLREEESGDSRTRASLN